VKRRFDEAQANPVGVLGISRRSYNEANRLSRSKIPDAEKHPHDKTTGGSGQRGFSMKSAVTDE